MDARSPANDTHARTSLIRIKLRPAPRPPSPAQDRAMETSPPPTGFQAVHDRYRPRVLRYLARVVGAAEAEDLTQEVMLKVSRALPEFRGDASLSTWIYRIATHTAMDSFRRSGVRPAIDANAEVEAAGDALALESPTPEDSAVRQEMSDCVREFVDRLPGHYRTILALRELAGLGNDEIAAVLDLPVGTVKIRLHRAREALRAALRCGCSFDHDRAGSLACDRKPVTVVRRP
jgi:RNA polymerase sigma-70 factor, ECF subfamily